MENICGVDPSSALLNNLQIVGNEQISQLKVLPKLLQQIQNLRANRRLTVGKVNIWEQPGSRIEMSPFGSIKDSGNAAKEGVLEAVKFFTNVKPCSLSWPT